MSAMTGTPATAGMKATAKTPTTPGTPAKAGSPATGRTLGTKGTPATIVMVPTGYR